jgi:hypothetical protein
MLALIVPSSTITETREYALHPQIRTQAKGRLFFLGEGRHIRDSRRGLGISEGQRGILEPGVNVINILCM